MKTPKQLDLFSKKIPEWKRRGFKSRQAWLKAKEFDRAWRHMEQANLHRLKSKYAKTKSPNFFRAFTRAIKRFFDET